MKKWYILHTVAGSEKVVKRNLLDQIDKKGKLELFDEIIIPAIETSEVKRGKVVKNTKTVMPGYILISMEMNDDSWHLVNSVAKVTGFLGAKNKPEPLSDSEVQKILLQLETASKIAETQKLYQIGQQLIITEGPFDGFTGIIDHVNEIKNELKLSVLIFGKPVIIDVNFKQVKKI